MQMLLVELRHSGRSRAFVCAVANYRSYVGEHQNQLSLWKTLLGMGAATHEECSKC